MQNAGHDTGPKTKQHTLGLTYTMRLLGLCPDTFQHRQHDAEIDAAMTRLIYTILLQLADGKPIVEKSHRTRNGLSRP